jgi:5'-3' exonuclease
VYKERRLRDFAYQKVAIDVSIYLCKFKTSYGKAWLDAVLQFVTVLRENDIHPVFIFDTEFPAEKDEEKKQRLVQRLKMKAKVEYVTKLWEDIKLTLEENQQLFMGPLGPELTDVYGKLEVQWDTTLPVSIMKMDQEIEKMNNSLLSIKAEDFDTLRALLDILQIPHFPAVGEAEATGSLLAKEGLVDAVMSEDTDCMAYAAPYFLHRVNFQTQTLMVVKFSEMIHALRMTSKQFLDLCIMCGTDYNKNIPKIGPDKSYRLLQKYESLDSIEACCKHLDLSAMPYKRVRELFEFQFTKEQYETFRNIPFCGFPDMNALTKFYFDYDCKFDIQKVYEAFYVASHLFFPDRWAHKNKAVLLLRPMLSAPVTAVSKTGAPTKTVETEDNVHNNVHIEEGGKKES